jgi:tetratricopeptide (TPR) repeat protein
MALLALLAACETSVEAPATVGSADSGKTSNIRARSGGSSYAADQNEAKSSTRVLADDEADQALLDAAEKMMKQGDLVSATVLYKRAVNAHPDSVSSLKGLAKLYEAQDKPREALETWRAIVALDENSAEAHRGMGRDMMAMGLYPKAIESLKRSHEIGGEDDLKTVNLLAMAQLRGGQPNDAIATLEEAVKSNDDLATKNNLGFAYVMAGELNKAIPLLEEVSKNPKATSQQRQNLALAYGLAGREEDARAIALQDLPPAAVANNLKTYRVMRDKLNGKATPVIEPARPKKKVRKPVVKKEAAPVAAPAPAPVTAAPVVPAPAPPAAAPAAIPPTQ